jgi:regulator of sigma E protease
MSGNFLLTLLQFVLVLGFLIFAHEFGHYIMARLFKIEVEEFGFGFPPRAKKLFTYKGTDFTLNWIPFGAFVRPKGENDPEVRGGLSSASVWVRLAVLLGGPVMNLLVGFLLFTALFSRVGLPDTSIVQIEEVSSGSPAQSAGLLPGDLVKEINDQPVTSMDGLHEIINNNKGSEVSVLVSRDGSLVTLQLTPRVDPPEGQGPVGIVMGNPYKPITFFQALPMAGLTTIDLSIQTVTMPVRLIRGDVPAEQARVVGPIGIFSIYRAANQRDAEAQSTPTRQPAASVLSFIAYISVALGITNLLPIPALDGGRILFIIPEIIFRKRVPAKYENFVHMIGFTALLLFMAFVTLQDVINPIKIP